MNFEQEIRTLARRAIMEEIREIWMCSTMPSRLTIG